MKTTKHILIYFMVTITLNVFAGRVIEHVSSFEGIERLYNVYLPESWRPGQKIPLVVAFHPFKNPLKLYMATSKLQPHAENNNMIIAYPAAATGIWNNGHLPEEKPYDDIGFVKKMLEEINGEYGYDETRVYSVGYSSGAFMSYRVAAELQDIFAASAVIGGSLSVPVSPEITRPKPIIQFHGLLDFVVPLSADKGLIGSRGGKNAILDWVPVNKVHENPVKSSGRLVNLDGKKGFSYIKLSYEPIQNEVGAPLEFYILMRAGHNFPLKLQNEPNIEIFKFFNRFSLQ
jgi:poly(3-hydroxybutyrate) depolymerase